jgi:cytochrome subunit of sulfide dehydrogenase
MSLSHIDTGKSEADTAKKNKQNNATTRRGDPSMKNARFTLLTAAFICGGLALPARAQDANLDRNLAASCVTCHGKNATGTGTLEGMPKDRLVQTMKDFKSGARPATLMHQLSKGYTEQQVELIAEYFSKQKIK